MLPLIIAPDPILRQKAKPIPSPVSAATQKFAQEMFEAMEHYKGIGLAAPQVGESVRLIVIATPHQPTAYINPVIRQHAWHKVTFEEGCLSLPGVYGDVRRPARVLASYTTLQGETKEEWLDGLIARVYQHEVDHLNGVLFIDLTNKITNGRELLTTYEPR